MTTTTLLSLAVDEVGPHPKNVRRDDTPDAELIASVESQGILQPLVVVPAPDDADVRFWLLMGHRRLAAAIAAGLEQLPAIVREDLAGEAEQIEAMLVENGRRADLTPVEEADAYQQLTLLGVDVDEISRTTGRSSSTVRGRLKIAGMATTAKEALHTRQITLEQAEQLTDLEQDEELHAEALAAIGTNDFAWKLSQATTKFARRRQDAEQIAAWEAEGLKQIERPAGWNQRTGPCPASWISSRDEVAVTEWAYFVDPYLQKVALVIDPQALPEPEGETEEQRERRLQREREQAEWDAKLAERRAARERHEAAGAIRLQTVHDTFASVKLSKAQTSLLRALVAAMIPGAYELGGREWLVEHDGLERDGNVWSITPEQVHAHVAKKSGVELLQLLTGWIASSLLESADAEDSDQQLDVVAYVDALEAAGHPISEPDTEWRAVAAAADQTEED